MGTKTLFLIIQAPILNPYNSPYSSPYVPGLRIHGRSKRILLNLTAAASTNMRRIIDLFTARGAGDVLNRA